jgi:hypothetical protein
MVRVLLLAEAKIWAGALLRMIRVNFDINVGRAPLERNVDVTIGNTEY